MAVNGLTAFVFGRLFDKHGIVVLPIGIAISVLALPLGFYGGQAAAALAVACWAIGLGVQDASLRAGIAQVVSMNKRGTAFGTFNGVYGVMWFLGSSAMGALYTVSLAGVVAFGVVSQLAGAALFLRLRGRLAAAAAAHD
jgi:MFS family permease